MGSRELILRHSDNVVQRRKFGRRFGADISEFSFKLYANSLFGRFVTKRERKNNGAYSVPFQNYHVKTLRFTEEFRQSGAHFYFGLFSIFRNCTKIVFEGRACINCNWFGDFRKIAVVCPEIVSCQIDASQSHTYCSFVAVEDLDTELPGGQRYTDFVDQLNKNLHSKCVKASLAFIWCRKFDCWLNIFPKDVVIYISQHLMRLNKKHSWVYLL